jgi:hypothetical protein
MKGSDSTLKMLEWIQGALPSNNTEAADSAQQAKKRAS